MASGMAYDPEGNQRNCRLLLMSLRTISVSQYISTNGGKIYSATTALVFMMNLTEIDLIDHIYLWSFLLLVLS